MSISNSNVLTRAEKKENICFSDSCDEVVFDLKTKYLFVKYANVTDKTQDRMLLIW